MALPYDQLWGLHGWDEESDKTMQRKCEIAACDREATTDVPATGRDGAVTALVVCEPCANAFNAGRNDPNA